MQLSLRRAGDALPICFRELIRRLSWLLPTRELGLHRIFCLTCLSLSGKRMLRLLAIIAVWGWGWRSSGSWWNSTAARFGPRVRDWVWDRLLVSVSLRCRQIRSPARKSKFCLALVNYWELRFCWLMTRLIRGNL